jgi:hypothetical protein
MKTTKVLGLIVGCLIGLIGLTIDRVNLIVSLIVKFPIMMMGNQSNIQSPKFCILGSN